MLGASTPVTGGICQQVHTHLALLLFQLVSKPLEALQLLCVPGIKVGSRSKLQVLHMSNMSRYAS